MMARKRLPRRRTVSLALLGGIVAAVVGAVLLASVYKPQLRVAMMDGEERTIRLRGNHFLLPNVSTVKVAGVDVGFVTEVERSPDGTAVVTVKVEDGVTEAVGSRPIAALRPNTLLGGKYYIDVRPGGDRHDAWTDPIPLARTRMPVEVDDVAQAMQPDALKGAAAALRQFDQTLDAGGTRALQQLLADTPGVMRPGARVLEALRGQNPKVDLARLVSALDVTAGVLTRREGQLEESLDDLYSMSSALADGSAPLAAALDRLPGTLDTTDTTLTRLRTSLGKVRDTAAPARPMVRELGDLVDRAEPVLARGVPVIRDLRLAIADARPLLRRLVPLSRQGTQVLDTARGPVLDRINGPIRRFTFAPYDGSGPYRHTQGDAPFFKELGYMFSGTNATGAYVDPNGHAVAFQPGGGTGTVAGLGPFSIEEMLQHLFLGEELR